MTRLLSNCLAPDHTRLYKYTQSQFLFCIRSGVPAIVDFAAMRDAIKTLGGDPQCINPICPADLVIDHSIQVDVAKK